MLHRVARLALPENVLREAVRPSSLRAGKWPINLLADDIPHMAAAFCRGGEQGRGQDSLVGGQVETRVRTGSLDPLVTLRSFGPTYSHNGTRFLASFCHHGGLCLWQ